MSPEDSDLPRHKLPYERHHKSSELPQPAGPPSLDPVQWKPIRLGLTLVLAGWTILLAVIGVLTLCLFVTFVRAAMTMETLETFARGAGFFALVGVLLVLAGKCTCCLVPGVAGARRWIFASVLASVGTLVAGGMLLFAIEIRPAALPEAPPAGDKTQPEVVPPQPEASPPKQDAVPPPAEVAAPKADSQPPLFFIPPGIKWLALACYLVSQITFTYFLKRVAHYHNDLFLAESMGGYLTLFVVHAALAALLPPHALIACFFWLIMLALEMLLVAWLLKLVYSVRRAFA